MVAEEACAGSTFIAWTLFHEPFVVRQELKTFKIFRRSDLHLVRIDDHRKLKFVVLGWRFVWSRSNVRPLRVSTRCRGPIKAFLSSRGASSLAKTSFDGWFPLYQSTLDCAWEEEEEEGNWMKNQSPCSLLPFPCVGRRKRRGGGRQWLFLFFRCLRLNQEERRGRRTAWRGGGPSLP